MESKSKVRWIIYLALFLMGMAVYYFSRYTLIPKPNVLINPSYTLQVIGILITLLTGHLLHMQFKK